jgi:hypothetical protein
MMASAVQKVNEAAVPLNPGAAAATSIRRHCSSDLLM